MTVALTITSAVLSTLAGLPWLSPVLHAAAVWPEFYVEMKARRYTDTLVVVTRWAGTLLLSLIIIGVFVPHRLGSSLPLAGRAAEGIGRWLGGAAARPPVDFGVILWGTAGFLVAGVLTGGFLALVVGAVGLGSAAYGAVFFFAHGVNVFQSAIIALPLWEWSLFAAAICFLVPAAVPLFDRFVPGDGEPPARDALRRFMYAGGALLALSLLLRLVTAGAWLSLAQRWTVM